jgi:hypothetical protein
LVANLKSEVVSFKLVNGDEIVGVMVEETGDHYKVKNPVTMPDYKSFMTSAEGSVLFLRSTVMTRPMVVTDTCKTHYLNLSADV